MGPLLLFFFSSSDQRLACELLVYHIPLSFVRTLVVCQQFQIFSIGDVGPTKFAKMMLILG